MTLDDVDVDQRIVWVLGKGRRPRALPIGRKTAQALDRYLRVREAHRLAHLPQVWVVVVAANARRRLGPSSLARDRSQGPAGMLALVALRDHGEVRVDRSAPGTCRSARMRFGPPAAAFTMTVLDRSALCSRPPAVFDGDPPPVSGQG
jgi:hypothetical protein